MIRQAAAEFIGTFFLVLVGPGAVAVDARTGGALGVAGIALAFAFVILAMVAALGGVSGAHFNPAVTIALWAHRRIAARVVVPHLLAQCAGAIAAALLLRTALGLAGTVGATVPTIPVAAAFGAELLMSFALMLVVLAAVDGRIAAIAAPTAIGVTVGFCALVGGPLTGASMNPARSLGPAIAAGAWTAHWIYWVAPIAGMLLAALSSDRLIPRGTAPRPTAG